MVRTFFVLNFLYFYYSRSKFLLPLLLFFKIKKYDEWDMTKEVGESLIKELRK